VPPAPVLKRSVEEGWGGRGVEGRGGELPAVDSPCMVLLHCAGPLARTAQWKCAVARKGCCTHQFLTSREATLALAAEQGKG